MIMQIFRQSLLFLSNVRFILFCMLLMMILVVLGSLAQADIGSFAAQQEYFNSFWLYTRIASGFAVPVFPGGLTIGILWLVSLTASLFVRARYDRRHIGIVIAHVGVLMLLLGQIFTQILSEETQMVLEEGRTVNYSMSPRDVELAVSRDAGEGREHVVSIPWRALARREEVRTPLLPFTLRIRKAYANSRLVPAETGARDVFATQGAGTRTALKEARPSRSDEVRDTASAVVEVIDGGKSLGTWLFSTGFKHSQTVHAETGAYQFALRPSRHIFPFSLTLAEFSHDVYPGTDIPKNFSSLVRLHDPSKNENRQVLIFMNHPLRYGGYAFYQASYGKEGTVSILQVVRNPAWLAPYVSCTVILTGLTVQFAGHLLQFLRKQP